MAGGDGRTSRAALRVLARAGSVALTLLCVAGAIDDSFQLGFVSFAVVGTVIVWKRPANAIAWLLLSIGAIPSALALAPTGDGVAGVLGAALADLLSGSFGLVFFLVLLFPSGHLPSPRWRVPARVGGFAIGFIGLMDLVRYVDVIEPLVDAMYAPFAVVLVALGLAALVNVFRRMRRATGDEREQLRWFAYGAAVFPVLMLANAFGQGASWQGYALMGAFTLGLTAIAVGIGVAVLKYNLYAIDVVINKTIVFGSLFVFITALYAGVVVGAGSLLSGGSREPNLALSLVATTIVAFTFQPARERLQRFANRVVYGQRLSPYEAVASFAHRIAAAFAFDHVLPEMAAAAASGIGAARTRVRLFLPSGAEEEVHWPPESPASAFDRTVAVEHHGEVVGEIAIAKPRGEHVTRQDEVLLRDFASEAGMAMTSLRLTEELKHHLLELQESRRRLVSAQDAERRRMERDLHDGAQQQLVAMKIKLGLVKSMVEDTAPPAAKELLDAIHADASETINTLRDLARGLFPEALVRNGLAGAVQAHIDKCGIPATVEADEGLGRYAMEIEANVYFVIREALQNASKYAAGAPIAVTLRDDDGVLVFAVHDRGAGFDPAAVSAGSGTQNMRDRLEALGGAIEVTSAPGQGTTVRGSVPVVVDLRDEAGLLPTA